MIRGYILLGIFLVGCTVTETKTDQSNSCLFYQNGNVKSCEIQFENDSLKRITYFERDSGKVEMEEIYKNLDGNLRIVERNIFDSDGLKVTHSRIGNKELKFTSRSDTLFLGDTLSLVIEVVNPSYDFVDAFIGDYDKDLSLSSDKAFRFSGNESHQVSVELLATTPGKNKIKGYISDYTLEPINDSIAVTVQEDQYFEYYFRVVPQSDI